MPDAGRERSARSTGRGPTAFPPGGVSAEDVVCTAVEGVGVDVAQRGCEGARIAEMSNWSRTFSLTMLPPASSRWL